MLEDVLILIGVWCVLSVPLGLLLGRLLRGASPQPIEQPEVRVSNVRDISPRESMIGEAVPGRYRINRPS